MFWKSTSQTIYLVSTSVKTLAWEREAIQEIIDDYFGADQITHLLRPIGEVQIFLSMKEALKARHDTLKAVFVITLPKGLLHKEYCRGLMGDKALETLKQHLTTRSIQEIRYDQFCGDKFDKQTLQNPHFISPAISPVLDAQKTGNDGFHAPTATCT